VPAIGELMDEHTVLVDHTHRVRQDLSEGNSAAAMSRLAGLVADLERHVHREEHGIFRALRVAGDFVSCLLGDLEVHVEREDLGIFPVSVVTLGADGWALIERAHQESPSFLLDPAATGPSPTPDEESTCRRSH